MPRDPMMLVTFHYRYTVQNYGGRSRGSTARAFRGSFRHEVRELGPDARAVARMPATAGVRADGPPALTTLRRDGERFIEEIQGVDALLGSADVGDALVARFGGRRLFDARSAPWLPGTTNADRIAGHDHARADALHDAMVDAERFALVDGRLHVAVTEPVITLTADGLRVVGNDGPEDTSFRLDEGAAAAEEARRRGIPHVLDSIEVHEPGDLSKDPVTKGLRSAAHVLKAEMAGGLGWSPRATVAAYAALRDALGTYERPGDPDGVHVALVAALAAGRTGELAAAPPARQAAGVYELRAAMAPVRHVGMAP